MSIDNGVTWEDKIEQLESDASAPSTAIATREPPVEGILKPVSLEMIASAKKDTRELSIKGTTDATGYKAVKDAKWRFTKFRTATEAWKKKMNEDARKQIKANDEEAKVLLKQIEPEEERLQKMLTDIDVAIDKAKQQAEDELFDLRRSKLTEAAFGYPQFVTLSDTAVRMMSETEFDSELQLVRNRAENQAVIDEAAEKARFEQERQNKRIAEENRIASEKLAAERAEMERQRAEQAAAIQAQQDEIDKMRREAAEAQAKIDAETRRMAAERKAKEDAELLAIARQEAAEQAAAATEKRLADEADAARVKALADEAAKKRADALRPDREKLAAYADAILKVVVPDVSAAAFPAAKECSVAVEMAAKLIRQIAAKVT